MKKYLIIIFISFFCDSSVNAGLEGYGEIKLNSMVVKYFKQYLNTKAVQNEKEFQKKGTGWFFFVAESGEEFGFTYCPRGVQCTQDPVDAKTFCQKNVKKYLKRKEKCSLFAKKRFIVWDGKKIKIKRNATSSEIDAILKENGFID